MAFPLLSSCSVSKTAGHGLGSRDNAGSLTLQASPQPDMLFKHHIEGTWLFFWLGRPGCLLEMKQHVQVNAANDWTNCCITEVATSWGSGLGWFGHLKSWATSTRFQDISRYFKVQLSYIPRFNSDSVQLDLQGQNWASNSEAQNSTTPSVSSMAFCLTT